MVAMLGFSEVAWGSAADVRCSCLQLPTSHCTLLLLLVKNTTTEKFVIIKLRAQDPTRLSRHC